MAKVDVIKTSFAGGEFGASLLGRTDVAQYANACAIVENWLVRPYGSVISTPGTWLINEAKMSALNTDSDVRLIPFVFNQTDAYCIEMGDKYFRFYTNRGVVTSGTTIELSHIYSESEIRNVQFTQLNDIVYMAHPDHPPQSLERSSAYVWTIGDFDFLGGPFLDDNVSGITITANATAGTLVTITLSATSSTVGFVPSSSTLGHVNSYWKIGGIVTTSTTAIQGYVQITAVSSSTIAFATVMETLSGTTATTLWAEGAWSSVRGYPARVVFHEGRLYFARTTHEPQKVWGSQLFTYDNFALDSQADDEGINIKLASNQSNEIMWLASGNVLVAGSYGGPFVINSGGTGEAITPTNVTAKQEVSFGTEAIQPKRIGGFFYYVQRFSKKIRELFYNFDTDSYKAADKTILCPEVTGDGVVEAAYQEIPDTILWFVRTDGTIATLTREIDQEVQGWSRQITTGLYSSICSIPSQSYGYDEVWVVVKRTINGAVKKYVEMFEGMELPDRQDKLMYLHSALRFDAYNNTLSSSANISLSATSGTIVVTTSTVYFTVADEGDRIRTIDADGVTTGELIITSYSTTKMVTGTSRHDFSAKTYAGGLWGKSVDGLSGLSHLEAATVKVLADGGVDKPDKVVSEGTISLAYDYFVIAVGLPYTQKLYTLPFEAGSSRGTAQGKIQRISQIMFKVNRSYKGFKVGGTEALAERMSFRDPTTELGTPELLFTGIMSNINFKDDYRYGSQIMVINDEPFPVEILSIMAMLDTKDKG